jgi:glycosyltransferase involved in cell wall biosynthesis
MEEPIKVCHVVNSVGPTSIPADIAVALARRDNVESGVLAWFDADSFTGDELVDVSCVNADNGLFNTSAYRRARRVLRDYDVVHSHHCHSGTYAKPIAKQQGSALVSTEHNSHDGYTRKGRLSNGLLNPLADRVTCVSGAVYDTFQPWEKALLRDKPVEIVPNGVLLDRVTGAADIDWEPPINRDEDSILICNSAMLTEQKAHETLIEAIHEVNRAVDSDVELAITGKGERRVALEAHADRLGVSEQVNFLGLLERRRQVYKLMYDADVFAMPSRWEGFCVAVAEAMATGTPCVLSDIDVFKELYRGPARFHPVDDVGALADRLERLVRDADLRERLGEESRTLVEQEYDIETTAEQYAALFRDLSSSR